MQDQQHHRDQGNSKPGNRNTKIKGDGQECPSHMTEITFVTSSVSTRSAKTGLQ